MADLKLNLIPSGVMPVAYINQYDYGVQRTFEIFNGTEVYAIPTGYSVTLRATKPDGYGITTAGSYTVGQNVVTVTIPQQLTAVAGKAICELVFANANNVRIGTINFVLAIEAAALSDSTVISDSDIAYAEEVLDQLQSVQALGNQVSQNTAAISTEASTRAAAVASLQAADTALSNSLAAETSARQAGDTALADQIAALQGAVGAPQVAVTAAAMTDTSKIYVYTGSESGMTSGNWYYYDGSAWVSGGVYNAVAVNTDTTLSVAGMAADAKATGDQVTDLKSQIDKMYDDGQLLTISSGSMLHPTGDGTFTFNGETITYQEVTNQQNVIGFTFTSEIGKQYTVSCRLEFQSGSMGLYAVKGTAFSTTVYEGCIASITASGTYSFTFTASTGTTTIWVLCQSGVDSAVISNILCSAGWGYKHLDTAFTEEKFPAQGKAVGALADRVTAVENSVDRIIQDNNLVTINATTLRHTSGTATAVFDLPNGFTTNNSGNTNNLFGFNIPTQAKRTYRLKLNVVAGPIQSLYICKTDGYNSGDYIDKRENLVAGNSIDIEFVAVTNVTSVWFNQRYNVASIAVSDIFAGDDRLRYNRYILDYPGTEITVFRKILCIGDSITEGTFNYESGGSLNNVFTDARYSYPTILAKLSGCDVANYGHGGDTAQSWYARYQNEDLSGYDACIIMLGINDGVQNVGVANFRTGMTNIINKVKNENNGIRIFLATLIPAYSDYDTKYDPYITETRRLASEDFPDTFLIDINQYSECKYYTYYAQGHLTAIGYQELAKEFYTLISYTIHEDLQAFRNVQFIGTNYTYPDFANP